MQSVSVKEALLANTTQHVLPNGLKVLCLRKRSAPVVSLQVWYRTGSVNEREGIRGVSHFLEHMMFRGSRAVAAEEHARRVNAVGGHCNAFTAEDATAYVNCVPRRSLEMVCELEADRMRNLAIGSDVLDTERKVIIEEYHTYMNNPVAKAFLEFRQAFYGEHPYAVSPLGVLADIEALSVKKCREFYQQWYSPGNAVVVIVGDIESSEQALEIVSRHFGALRGNGAPAQPPETGTAEPGAGGRWMKRRVQFDVPILITGYPAPPSAHPDALALEILQQVVCQGESSRMHREVVRKASLAVMAGGMNHLLRLSGMSLFFAAFTPDVSARRVGAALDEQVRLVRERGISEAEMEKVRNGTLTSRTFEAYSAEHLCQRLGYSEVVEGDYRLWVERLAALERLDISTLTGVARKYWNEKSKHTLYLKPKRAKPLLYAIGMVRRVFGRGKA